MSHSQEEAEAAMWAVQSHEFWTQYQISQSLGTLEWAIIMQRRAAELMPEAHRLVPGILETLGFYLEHRYRRLLDANDLESMILVQQLVIQLTADDDLGMPARLAMLASILNTRFERLGELDDLDIALSTQRRAVELTAEGHPDMPGRLSMNGNYLFRRFERLGEPGDLDEAISMQRRAVELTSELSPDMPGWLNNFGLALGTRFERLGELNDLESAITMQRRALELTPTDHVDMPIHLNSLGWLLLRRFDRLGELSDLNSAISTQRRSVELTPIGHPNWPTRLGNLGDYLSRRFVRLEELDDLDSAILALRRAIELTPEDHPYMSSIFNSLGLSLLRRFVRLGEFNDINNAISVLLHAVDLTPEGHPDMAVRLNNLGMSLFERFNRIGELNDLNSAILTQRRVLELSPAGHPNTPGRLGNLGNSLRARFERLREVDDLNGAISAQRRAIELAPQGHPDALLWLESLAHTLLHHFCLHEDQHNFDAVVEIYKIASHHTSGLPFQRLFCAYIWALLETIHPKFGSSASRLQAHSRIIKTLPEVVWLGHSISRRYQESAKVANLLNYAVAAAFDFGELPRAVEWLEEGRGLIWSQVLSLRTPIDVLAQHYPDLANDLQQLSRKLQHAHLIQLPKTTSSINPFFADTTNQHQETVIEYESLLKKIRACEGFEHFLRPEKLADLTSLTKHLDGPFVYINVSSSRCDALVVYRGGTVKLIPLSELTHERADTLRAACMYYLRAGNVRKRETVPKGLFRTLQRAIVSRSANKTRGFFKMLDCTWKWIVHPILTALGLMNPTRGRLPHITWCPTGPLAQLPLHAAGLYPNSGSSGPHVYDFVVSSYTPSLGALVRAQAGAAQLPPSPSVLVVTQPNTPNLSSLPGAADEEARIRKILSGSMITSNVLSGRQATVQSVEAAIPKFSWVHLACHGVQDADDPSQSAFELHDGKLTLSTLMQTVAEGAELAFLSACQTATGDESIPEESAHLTAGMLAVGFKGVIGTMWSIGDDDAPIVVEAYYKKLLELRRTGTLTEGSTGAAYALHEAVEVLRKMVGEKSFMSWVPFVHYGV